MTLEIFKNNKIIVTDQQEIAEWKRKLTDEDDYDGALLSLHIYDNSYWIEERQHGIFGLIIENTEPTGTLEECEQILYDWTGVAEEME
jgi:hypothetical protein